MVADLKDINRLYVNYYDKAVRALNLGKIDEATRLISKAMSINPSQAPFHALRGFNMVKKKAYDDAEGNFSQALLIDHEYQPAIRGIGVVRYLKGDYLGSIAYLKKGLGLFPNDMASHYFLGMSYYKTGAYSNAISYLKRFADTNPNHPAIHGVLGICYEATGDEASAYNAYRRQLKVAPNNEMGRRAATRASLLERRLR
jgi:tetratricopeptide (TPR) repeat protein